MQRSLANTELVTLSDSKRTVAPITRFTSHDLRVEVFRYLDAKSICFLFCVSHTFRSDDRPSLWTRLCADSKIPVPTALSAKSMFKQSLNPTILLVRHLDGTSIEVTINSLTTLEELKAQVTKKTNAIHKKTPIESWQLRLITGNRQLDGEDTRVLSNLDRNADGTLHCILRMPRATPPTRRCIVM